jgi:nucleolar GTP-binding protein
LFHSIKPLFANKPTLLVLNKIDVMRLENVSPESQALVNEISSMEGVITVHVSCYTDEGVTTVKQAACDALLAHRVENKLKGNAVEKVANRIHVAMPKARDDVKREPFIPDVVKERKKYDKEDPTRRKLLRDVEAENGGAGVFNLNLKGRSLFKGSDTVVRRR